jgi:DNA-directed RNA polymerase specialized sigma24 family protein
LVFEPAEITDLRRKRSRALVDQLVEYAQWLAPPDRVLIEAVYRDGRSVSDVATLMGESVRTLRRRVRMLIERINSPRFMFVVRSLDQWAPTRRRVAICCVLHGRPLRAVAEELGLSLHVVRRHRDAVYALYEGAVCVRA